MIIPTCKEHHCKMIRKAELDGLQFEECKAYPGMEHLKWRNGGCPMRPVTALTEAEKKARIGQQKQGSHVAQINAACGYRIDNYSAHQIGKSGGSGVGSTTKKYGRRRYIGYLDAVDHQKGRRK